MKGDLKLIELEPVTQTNEFRNNLRPVRPEPVYEGKNPGLFTIEQIIGRPCVSLAKPKSFPIRLVSHNNPGIALMYSSERVDFFNRD